MKKRLPNIDLIKGLLILLVIAGHVIGSNPFDELNRENSLILALIYSFHIPLFIGVSGYLVNFKKLTSGSFSILTKNYRYRIILPWIIAALVYFLFSDNFSFSIYYPIKAILKPFYHLWFIPDFLFCIFLTWSLKKLNVSNTYLLGIGFCVTLLAVFFKKHPPVDETSSLYPTVFYFLNVVKPYYYLFFVFGVYCKNRVINTPLFINYSVIILSSIGVFYFYYFPNKILSTLNLFMLNGALIVFCVNIASQNLAPRSHFIEWVGKHSLGLYLWHVIPIIIAKYVSENEKELYYWASVILFEIIFFIVYKLLSKHVFFRKYIFGLN